MTKKGQLYHVCLIVFFQSSLIACETLLSGAYSITGFAATIASVTIESKGILPTTSISLILQKLFYAGTVFCVQIILIYANKGSYLKVTEQIKGTFHVVDA